MAQSFRLSPSTALLLLALVANIVLWTHTREKLPVWANVPPAPSSTAIQASFLGDAELAYRSTAITLQNFGSTAGRVQALKDYNYNHLATWFDVGDKLNPRSDYIAFLAAYYFGANQNPKELMPVINYLRRVGTYKEGDKWRYLGHAVFLARHKMKDMTLAKELADELAAQYRPGLPGWVLQMRAIIASDMGEKEMAYNLLIDSLQTGQGTLDPAEIRYMKDKICLDILTPTEKAKNPLCQQKQDSQ